MIVLKNAKEVQGHPPGVGTVSAKVSAKVFVVMMQELCGILSSQELCSTEILGSIRH